MKITTWRAAFCKQCCLSLAKEENSLQQDEKQVHVNVIKCPLHCQLLSLKPFPSLHQLPPPLQRCHIILLLNSTGSVVIKPRFPQQQRAHIRAVTKLLVPSLLLPTEGQLATTAEFSSEMHHSSLKSRFYHMLGLLIRRQSRWRYWRSVHSLLMSQL